jgi:L-rhamnose-H+ transport protein
MTPNPLLGVLFHWLGGLSSASFYVPYRGVRRWSWEIFWLTGGIFSWLLAPWLFASIQTNDLLGVMAQVPPKTVGLCVMFGVLWGFGGLTYGLTMRYLGLSLGMAVVLGLCTVFGTLIPPIWSRATSPTSCWPRLGPDHPAGPAGHPGRHRRRRLGRRQEGRRPVARAEEGAVAEFDFSKGIAVAVFSGIMSACFAFGLSAGEPIKALSAAAGTGPLWTGLPTLCLVMFGGLITNGLWCAWLIFKNRSAGQWLGAVSPAEAADKPETAALKRSPLLANYLLCAVAGTAWYFQFFFYTMGESQMGRFGFSSWTLHMASIIIFGTLWGFAFREWKDARPRVKAMVWTGVALLVGATVIIGYGNQLGA